MLTRPDKEKIVSRLKAKIEKSSALFVTNLVGLPSNNANELRRQVREAKGAILIARNTLLKRAVAGTKSEELFKAVKGPTAVALAFEDAPGVAKALYEAGKEFEEIVKIRGGLLGEQLLTTAEVVALAKLPGRSQMLATLLATFNAPVSAFVRTLQAIKEKKETETAQS